MKFTLWDVILEDDSSGFTNANACYGFHGSLDITIISGQLIYQFVHEFDTPVAKLVTPQFITYSGLV